MSRRKILMKLALLIPLALFLIEIVSAIGITPSKIQIDYKGAESRDTAFFIHNSENANLNLTLYSEGDLSQYISFYEKRISFAKNETRKQVSFKINIPENLEGGIYYAKIFVIEEGANLLEEKTNINSNIGVAFNLVVSVPYTEKKLKADVKIGEDGWKKLFVEIKNVGLRINNAYVNYTIFNSKGEVVFQNNSEEFFLDSGETKEIWTEAKNLLPGKYKAKIIINYDNEKIESEKEFEVRENAVQLIDLKVKDFRSIKEPVKFVLKVNNRLERRIPNSYSYMSVFDSRKTEISSAKSPFTDLSPGLNEIVYYWNSEDMNEGIYDGEILLRYEEYVVKKDIKIEIKKNSIKVYSFEDETKMKGNFFLISLIGLILIIIALIMFRLKRKK